MRIYYTVPLLAIAAAPASHATTLQVGGCLANFTNFTSIGAAITAAGPNAIIKICPGTYAEQLTINKSLRLVGVASGNSSQVLIVPPAGGLANNAPDFDNGNQPNAAQIAVQGATVSISGLTIDGTGNGVSAYGCAWDVMGIVYQNASGTVMNNLVRNEYAAPFASYGGCQSGQGIYVQTSAGNTSNVVISKNSVENYAKNGITGNDAGTSVTISSNTVQGVGPTPIVAQNSVQIAYGATGSVTSNVVGSDVYTGSYYGSAGILVYASAGVHITGNTVDSTQYAIAVEGDNNGDADGTTISTNKVGVTYQYDAIDVCGAGNATISGNSLDATDEAAIHLDSTCGSQSTNNTVSNNIISGACAAVLEGTGSGGTIGSNTISNAANAILTNSDVCPVDAPALRKLGSMHQRHAFPAR